MKAGGGCICEGPRWGRSAPACGAGRCKPFRHSRANHAGSGPGFAAVPVSIPSKGTSHRPLETSGSLSLVLLTTQPRSRAPRPRGCVKSSTAAHQHFTRSGHALVCQSARPSPANAGLLSIIPIHRLTPQGTWGRAGTRVGGMILGSSHSTFSLHLQRSTQVGHWKRAAVWSAGNGRLTACGQAWKAGVTWRHWGSEHRSDQKCILAVSISNTQRYQICTIYALRVATSTTSSDFHPDALSCILACASFPMSRA
jgi:hypothetical protein